MTSTDKPVKQRVELTGDDVQSGISDTPTAAEVVEENTKDSDASKERNENQTTQDALIVDKKPKHETSV